MVEYKKCNKCNIEKELQPLCSYTNRLIKKDTYE